MLRRMVGLVFLVAGLAAAVGSRADAAPPKSAGSSDVPATAAGGTRRRRKRVARPSTMQSKLPEGNNGKLLEELQKIKFKDSEKLPAVQAKAGNAVEADKLAKRNARPPETAVHSVSTALQRIKGLAGERSRPSRKLSNARRKSIGCRQTAIGKWHVWSPPRSLSHTSTSLCVTRSRPLQPVSRLNLSSHSWMRVSQAFHTALDGQERRCRHGSAATFDRRLHSSLPQGTGK